MFGRLPRQPIWFCVTLVGVGSAPAAGAGSPPVRVTVWEGLPKGWAWQAPAGDPAERFDWPAVGFVRLPARYNARGIRGRPGRAVRGPRRGDPARAARTYRLILRSRGASRVLVDGRVLAETKPVNPNSAGHEDVPEVAPPEDPRWRYVATGDQEQVVTWVSARRRTLELWSVVGERKAQARHGRTLRSASRHRGACHGVVGSVGPRWR